MEDDEEIQSHASHNTDEDDDEHVNVDVVVEQSKQQIENVENSRQSPPISGGVTVAVVPTTSTSTADVSGMSTPPPPSSSLTLALPIQQNSARVVVASAVSGGGISYGRDDCWSEAATAVLIEAWGERYMELSRGNLKQKHWKEVADIVSSRDDFGKIPKTDIQCKNRIDTVKKKYKVEKSKVVAGCGPSRWPFYDRIDHLIGPTAAANSAGKAAVVAAVSGSGNGGIIPEAVPVGIPFGIRHQQISLPFPSYGSPQLRPPPHLQPPQPQPLSMRHVFPTPVRFNHHNVNPNYANNVRHHQMMQQQQQQQQQQFRRSPMVAQQAAPPQQPAPPAVESEEEAGGWSNESEDSLPPETGYERRKKRARTEATTTSVGGRMKKNKGVREWGKSVRELTRAILKFGEAYEMAESAKLEHIVEMEKQRMKFAKELELQRMKFLMKTQLELSQFNTTVVGSENGVGSSTRRGNGGGSGGVSGGGVENNHVH